MKTYITSLLMITALAFTSCKKDDKDPTNNSSTENEQELITTVIITLEDSNNNIESYTFSDPDGAGGADATVEPIQLFEGQVYSVNIQFLDKSNPSAPVDLTTEINNEGAEHMVCYTTDLGGISVTKTDSDGTYPIGLTSSWEVDPSSDATTITITLKHQPGLKDGTCAPGETDVEVTFPIQYFLI